MFFVSGVLFSYGYIARNVEHDCTGRECPICMHLQQAAQFLSNIKTMSTTPVFLAFLSVFTLGVVYPRVFYRYARFPEGGIAELI